MRDGVILRGNLYTPEGHGPWPVLLLRSVFRKDHLSRAFSQYDPAFFVKHGYAVYIQDVRGLGASNGEFDRFTADGPDGYDTIEYLAAQPWCTGRVGMMGSYYAGYLQMMAARRIFQQSRRCKPAYPSTATVITADSCFSPTSGGT